MSHSGKGLLDATAIAVALLIIIPAILFTANEVEPESSPRWVTFCSAEEVAQGDYWEMRDVGGRTYALPSELLVELNEVQPDRSSPVVPSVMRVEVEFRLTGFLGGARKVTSAEYEYASGPVARFKCEQAGLGN